MGGIYHHLLIPIVPKQYDYFGYEGMPEWWVRMRLLVREEGHDWYSVGRVVVSVRFEFLIGFFWGWWYDTDGKIVGRLFEADIFCLSAFYSWPEILYTSIGS